MEKLKNNTCFFLCAFILQMFCVNAVAASMSDEEFTALTGSAVEDAFCVDSDANEKIDNWSKNVANIQLKLNVEKLTRSAVKKFKGFQKVSSEKQKYRKIKIKLDGTDCWMLGKYRLTGDMRDHFGSNNEIIHSIKIKITDGRINNILKFKLLAPKTRTGKMEVFNYLIHKKLGLLAPRTALVNVQIGGETYEAIFQEDINEQLLEHNDLHEAMLLEGNESFIPFTFPKMINRSFAVNNRFKEIKMYVFDNLGRTYNKTGQYAKEQKLVDKTLVLDYLPSSSKKEFIYFHLLNFSLNNIGGLSADDSRFVFDHIARRYRPIYYDGHAGERISKVADLNFNIPDDIRLRLLKSFETLDLIKLKSELSVLGAQFSVEELQQIMSDAIIFVKAVQGEEVSHEVVKSSKNFVDFKLIEENALNFISNKNMESLQVFWMLNPSELKKCVYHKNGKNCSRKNLNDNQKLALHSEAQSLNRGIFLHGLSRESLFTPYFQELALNRLVLSETGTIIEHTSNLALSVNFGAKTILVSAKYENATTSQIKVSGGILDDWEFIIGKDVFLGYEKHPDTRASKFGLTGCITFNDLIVKSLKIQMQGAMCEDAIHFVRTKGDIGSITVTKAFADAIDADFSDLVFNNINISEAGNDCVDFSAGTYQIVRSKFYNCGDKGLSAGEGSDVILGISEVRNALIGIVAKDGSRVLVEEVAFSNVDVCLAAYKKKQEYGTARLEVKKIDCSSKKYFRQNGSRLKY
ncbi:hypothetical protein N9R24_04890 [Amylibacter sp.]|nr:hypothetical protein [Amylibacter sp.]